MEWLELRRYKGEHSNNYLLDMPGLLVELVLIDKVFHPLCEELNLDIPLERDLKASKIYGIKLLNIELNKKIHKYQILSNCLTSKAA